jgi:hypothetical protein
MNLEIVTRNRSKLGLPFGKRHGRPGNIEKKTEISTLSGEDFRRIVKEMLD